MKTVTVPERSFDAAFKQAGYDVNKALHDADDRPDASPPARLAVALSDVHHALAKLRERLIEAEL